MKSGILQLFIADSIGCMFEPHDLHPVPPQLEVTFPCLRESDGTQINFWVNMFLAAVFLLVLFYCDKHSDIRGHLLDTLFKFKQKTFYAFCWQII